MLIARATTWFLSDIFSSRVTLSLLKGAGLPATMESLPQKRSHSLYL